MEAIKFADLLKPKSMFRYLKKGVALGVLTGLITYILGLILSAVNGGIPIKLETMAQVGALSGMVLVALTLTYLVYGIVVGFLVEYINNANNKVIRWVRK